MTSALFMEQSPDPAAALGAPPSGPTVGSQHHLHSCELPSGSHVPQRRQRASLFLCPIPHLLPCVFFPRAPASDKNAFGPFLPLVGGNSCFSCKVQAPPPLWKLSWHLPQHHAHVSLSSQACCSHTDGPLCRWLCHSTLFPCRHLCVASDHDLCSLFKTWHAG